MAYLRTLFGNRIWSLQAELEWSPHSPDLAPLDFFFWGAAKAEVYKENPRSLRQLKQTVEAFAQSVTTDTCCPVIENSAVLINACANRNGAHKLQQIWIGYRHVDAHAKITKCLRLSCFNFFILYRLLFV